MGESPTDERRNSSRPAAHVLEVGEPRERHEYVRADQKERRLEHCGDGV